MVIDALLERPLPPPLLFDIAAAMLRHATLLVAAGHLEEGSRATGQAARLLAGRIQRTPGDA
jgi:hypothetical protein